MMPQSTDRFAAGHVDFHRSAHVERACLSLELHHDTARHLGSLVTTLGRGKTRRGTHAVVVPGRLALAVVALALVAPATARAARGCADGRFVVRGEDGALIVGTAPRAVIVVRDGRVAIEGTCAADTTRKVHVRRTRGGTH